MSCIPTQSVSFPSPTLNTYHRYRDNALVPERRVVPLDFKAPTGSNSCLDAPIEPKYVPVSYAALERSRGHRKRLIHALGANIFQAEYIDRGKCL